MGVLTKYGVESVFHYTPLHYLPFICRAGALLTKPDIVKQGYSQKHFRSKSNVQDIERGFGSYAFLTLDSAPPILKAKLAAGFPHIQLSFPASEVEKGAYSLCRYNVAMTRYLRRDGKSGFPESPSNGRYYDTHQIPVARTDPDKEALVRAHLNKSMIEVLAHGNFVLPEQTKIVTFSKEDEAISSGVASFFKVPWTVVVEPPPAKYNRDSRYADAVIKFIDRAIAESEWRGDGLEFDRV